MLNRSLSALLLVSAGLIAAPPAPEPSRWAQFQLAHLDQRNSDCVESSPGYGAGYGTWLTPQWGWEATWLHGSLKDTRGLWKADEDHLGATVLYAPWAKQGRWTPFLRAGLGASRLQNPLSLTGKSGTFAHFTLGAGAQLELSERMLATLEVRSISVDTRTRRQEIAFLAGLGWRWRGDDK